MTTVDPFPPPAPDAGRPTPYAAAATYDAASASGRAPHSSRALAGAIAVYLGGYLVLASVTGQLTSVLGGFAGGLGPGIAVLLISQLLFAVAVVVIGLLITPGSVVGKIIGALLVVVAVPTFILISVARLSGSLRMDPYVGGAIVNAWFVVPLIIGIAWLATRRARFGWLALVPLLALLGLPLLLVLGNVDPALTQALLLGVTGLIGAGVILAGRPWAR